MASPEVATIEHLVDRLEKERMERASLKTKCEHLEGSLARATDRIARLTVSSGGCDPLPTGVSKKVLEGLVRENVKLKQSMDRITQSESEAKLAFKNEDLHQIIFSLMDEKDEQAKEVEELKKVLTTARDKVTEALFEKAANLSAKVVSQETKLVKLLTKVHGTQVYIGEDADDANDQDEQIKAEIQKTEAEIAKHANRSESGENESLDAKIVTLAQELDAERRERKRLQDELKEKGVADGSNASPEGVNRQLDELQKTLSVVEKERDELKTELELMKSTLSDYENDFRIERAEKTKALEDRKKLDVQLMTMHETYLKLQSDYDRLKLYTREMINRSKTGNKPPTAPASAREPDPFRLDARPVASPRGRVGDILCPECHKMFPYQLLEDHMKSCSG